MSKITRINYHSTRGARSCTLILINDKDEMIPRALSGTQPTVFLSSQLKSGFHFTHDAHNASFIFVVHRTRVNDAYKISVHGTYSTDNCRCVYRL